MPILVALLLLGVVQGLTEFLPVSSSGHLVLLSKIFGIEESLFISIILHVATLLSVMVVMRKEVFYYLRHPFSLGAKKIVFASIPTCIIALIIMPIVEKAFGGIFLPVCFMITAIILAITQLFSKNRTPLIKISSPDFLGISYKQAFIMGVCQGFAIFPGISRSGSTICGGIFAGGEKTEVAKFSFLMSVPIILLSLFKEIFEIVSTNAVLKIDVAGIIISFIAAFIIGVLAIKFMIKITEKARFLWFGVYLVLLSILSIFVI